MLGFRGEVLLPYLDKEHVQQFLKPGAEVTWETDSANRESVLAEARRYMAFAWGKVQDHRGIPAGRSVQKLTEWCWLLGEDELVETGTKTLAAALREAARPALLNAIVLINMMPEASKDAATKVLEKMLARKP